MDHDQVSGRTSRRAAGRWVAWALTGIILAAGALWQITAPNGDLFQYRCFGLAFWRGSAGAPPATGCAGRLPAGVYPAFHLLPREYPPLAIIPFSAPLLFGGLLNMTLYALAFNALMALCFGATAWLIGRFGEPARHRNARAAQCLYLLWLALGATTIALVRFDALPALLTVGALALASRSMPTGRPMSAGRHARQPWARYAAYALLAVGALLKLYPALLIPLLAAWDWRREWRPQTALGAAAMLVDTTTTTETATETATEATSKAAAPTERGPLIEDFARRWVWLGGPLLAALVVWVIQGGADLVAGVGGASWLSVQGRRPPQIESTAAALLWLWQVALGRGDQIHPVSVERSASFIEAPGRALATATLALALLAIAWACVAIAGGVVTPLRGIAGATLALLGGAAIFSPQYLVWAIPLVALALMGSAQSPALATTSALSAMSTTQGAQPSWRRPSRNAWLIALWSVVCLCTTIIYSVGYLLGWPAHTGGPLAAFMLFVLARDLLVWVCATLLLWPESTAALRDLLRALPTSLSTLARSIAWLGRRQYRA